MASSYLCVYPPAGAWEYAQVIPVISPQDCTAIDPGAYLINLASSSQPSLQDIFDIPLAADLLQMWELGFGLPMLCYLTAWGYGVVINFFNDKRH